MKDFLWARTRDALLGIADHSLKLNTHSIDIGFVNSPCIFYGVKVGHPRSPCGFTIDWTMSLSGKRHYYLHVQRTTS